MIILEASGKLACFTRPEFKVERVSYDVIPPTAARGLLEAVFWKPQFTYVVTRIEVLKPIKRMSASHIELPEIRSKTHNPAKVYTRDIRQTECLVDVHYRISADIVVNQDKIDPDRKGINVMTYIDQFRKRLERKRFFRQPCFGLQELWARVSEPSTACALPITKELGMMVHSIDYTRKPAIPRFWPAILECGVMRIPPVAAEEVYSVC
jgi:CRISPR-associated protein Cas5d